MLESNRRLQAELNTLLAGQTEFSNPANHNVYLQKKHLPAAQSDDPEVVSLAVVSGEFSKLQVSLIEPP